MTAGSLSPQQLGVELRTSKGSHVRHRRAIVGLTLFACGSLATVALYQIGTLKQLPQPPVRGFDAEAVNGSGEAYGKLLTPDAYLGLASYSVTACLAAIGPPDRAKSYPWMPLALCCKLLADTGLSAKLSIDQVTRLRSISIWSLIAALATWTALPLAIPEAKLAWMNLRK